MTIDDQTSLTGGCMCGAVRYAISAEPMVVSHCHCGDCRRASGAPFITWITVASDGFAVTAGEPAEFRSSPAVRRGFCAACGTTLCFQNDGHPEEIDVAAASLDDPARVTPQDHLMVGSRLPWIHMADGLPELEGGHWEHGYPAKD